MPIRRRNNPYHARLSVAWSNIQDTDEIIFKDLAPTLKGFHINLADPKCFNKLEQKLEEELRLKLTENLSE